MTGNVPTIKLSFDEVSFLLKAAESGLKSAIAEDRKAVAWFARPFTGNVRKTEYASLLAILQNGVTASKAYGSCEITLNQEERATLSQDCQKYRQANAVSPEQQKAIDKVNKA